MRSKCAPGPTTDLEDGSPGYATFEMMNLPVAGVLTQMIQTGLAHASINDVVVQNGVTTQQASVYICVVILFIYFFSISRAPDKRGY